MARTSSNNADERTTYTEGEERNLGRRIQSGDSEALHALILAYDPLAIAEATTHQRHHGGDLEDLISEARLRLCMCANSYDPERVNRFAGYAVKNIRLHLLTYLCGQAKHGNAVSLTADLVDSRNSDATGDTEQAISDLIDCLKFLPTQQRKALEMRYGLDGNGEHEAAAIAEALGLSLSMTWRVLAKATENLKRSMDSIGGELSWAA